MKHENKNLNDFVDELLASSDLDQPSIHFTDNLLQKIEATKTSNTTVYKPLISNFIWMLLGLVFLVIVVYTFSVQPTSKSRWLDSIDLSVLNQNPFRNLNFSKTMMYACVLLTVMIGIQIPVLKSYFNKRTSY